MKKILPVVCLICIIFLASLALAEPEHFFTPCCLSEEEVCDEIDNDQDGVVDEDCEEECFDGLDNDKDGFTDEGCEDICFNGLDEDQDGEIDEHCREICDNGIDDDLDGIIDKDCPAGNTLEDLMASYCIRTWESNFEKLWIAYSLKKPGQEEQDVFLFSLENSELKEEQSCLNAVKWSLSVSDESPALYCEFVDSKQDNLCTKWTSMEEKEFDCRQLNSKTWLHRGNVEFQGKKQGEEIIVGARARYILKNHSLFVKEDCYGESDCYYDRERILARGFFQEKPLTKGIEFPNSANGYFLTKYVLAESSEGCQGECIVRLVLDYPAGQKILFEEKGIEVEFALLVGLDENSYAACFVDRCGDNKDNDRDGLTDEGCFEICFNGFDDDGDKLIDEGCCSYSKQRPLNELICGCRIGTALCFDGSCSKDCGKLSGLSKCDEDGDCELEEGCSCMDCIGKQSNCVSGAVCGVSGVCICPSGKEICVDGSCRENCKVEEKCFNGFDDDKDGEIDEDCACFVGTALCADGSCSKDCKTVGLPKCNKNNECREGEGCDCSDCFNQQGPCGESFVCGKGGLCVCPENTIICKDFVCRANCGCMPGTTLCMDGSCSENCLETDGGFKECISLDGICERMEGCSCEDCQGENASCSMGALCDKGFCACQKGRDACDDGSCREQCPLEICNEVDDDGDENVDEDCLCPRGLEKCENNKCREDCSLKECALDERICLDNECRGRCPEITTEFRQELFVGERQGIQLTYGRNVLANAGLKLVLPSGEEKLLQSDEKGFAEFLSELDGNYSFVVGEGEWRKEFFFSVEKIPERTPSLAEKIFSAVNSLGLVGVLLLIVLCLFSAYLFFAGSQFLEANQRLIISRALFLLPLILAFFFGLAAGLLLALIEFGLALVMPIITKKRIN